MPKYHAALTETIGVRHVPDGFRHTGVRSPIAFDPTLVIRREGDCFVAEVDDFDLGDGRYRNHFHVGRKKVHLRPGDPVPLILCYRRSMMEFGSAISDYALSAGDPVWILGGDGYAGSFESALPEYGKPIAATIRGALPGQAVGSALNVADFEPAQAATGRGEASEGRPLTVAVVGSRMDCGKSTTGLRARGRRTATGKVTGFGCYHETVEHEGDCCLDFTDYGLPSTCGKDGTRVRRIARRVLDDLRRQQPDVVILEFGEALIGPYRVDEVLEDLSSEIDLTLFVALDQCGVAGGIERFRQLGIEVAHITGPVANTPIAVQIIESRHGLPAETNREGMPRLIAELERRLAQRSGHAPRPRPAPAPSRSREEDPLPPGQAVRLP